MPDDAAKPPDNHPDATRTSRHARVVAALTLASRLLGLGREMAMTYYFGTGQLFSAFRLAFMVPNLARRLFGEGALSAATIPVLTESLQVHGENASRRLVGSLLTRLLILLTILLLIAEAAVLTARYFTDDHALELTAWILPYMVLICGIAVIGGVLNIRGSFAIPAAMPALLNVTMIVALIAGAEALGIERQYLPTLLCIVTVATGAAQLLLMFAALRYVRFFPIFTGPEVTGMLGKVVRMMGPMAVGLSAVQLSALADYLIAYIFITVDGERVGPAVLGTAQFLYQLPLGVFGIAIATAVFPRLARLAAADRLDELVSTLGRGVRMALFIALPSAVGLMFVGATLIEALYERGEFDAASTRRVAGALFFYSMGLPAYFVNHLLARTFYSLKNSRTPARAALAMTGVNLLLNLLLVGAFAEKGLALATAVCAWLQTLVLWRALPDGTRAPARTSVTAIVRIAAAVGLMALALAGLPRIEYTRNLLLHSAVTATVVTVGTGVVAYLLASLLLGVRELGEVVRRRL